MGFLWAPIAPFPNKTKASVLMYHLFRLVANALTEAENHREEAFPWLCNDLFIGRTMGVTARMSQEVSKSLVSGL